MKLISSAELAFLVDQAEGLSISIYLSTEQAGKETQQNAIRFKNLVRRVEQRILDRGLLRPRETDELLRPLRVLIEDVPFWQHQLGGLAVFLSGELFRYYRVPIRFRELAEVERRFHLKPLFRLLSGDGEFHVLSLNRGSVRLFRSSRFRIEAVQPEDMPADLVGPAPGEGASHQLQRRRTGAVFHGHGAGDEDEVPELRRILVSVDRAVCAALQASESPLLLAGSDELVSLYRTLSHYPNLASPELRSNTSELRPEEIRERAWPLVEPLFVLEQSRTADRYRRLSGTAMASSSLGEIVPASHDGRVEALFVARGRYRWGDYDPEAREVQVRERRENGGLDLLDLAAAQTLLHQGKVFVVDPERLPEGGGTIAAVFRY